jgi:hypothetical protein
MSFTVYCYPVHFGGLRKEGAASTPKGNSSILFHAALLMAKEVFLFFTHIDFNGL